MNTKQQAAVGVGAAIAYFTREGYAVFVPTSDVSRFDLLVEKDGEISRVEVKTTRTKSGDVGLRTLGGNQSWNGEVKRIAATDCDIVFLYNVQTDDYLLCTAQELEGRATKRIPSKNMLL